jgi:hypothetical protein
MYQFGKPVPIEQFESLMNPGQTRRQAAVACPNVCHAA